jgi:hypothetical protein
VVPVAGDEMFDDELADVVLHGLFVEAQAADIIGQHGNEILRFDDLLR